MFLNFAEDHLDRHATLDEYLAAKLRLFAHQPESARRGAERRRARAAGRAARAARARSGSGPTRAASCAWTARASSGAASALMEAAEVGLRGPHNLENAMAAAAATLARGVDPDAVRDGPARVPRRPAPARGRGRDRRRPLCERLQGDQRHGRRGGAARRSSGVHAILGGSLKGGGFEPLLAPVVAERCRACYLIGEAAERLAEDLAVGRCASCTGAATSSVRWRPPRRARSPARWCCSRRPAPASTSTRTSRSAASTSARS